MVLTFFLVWATLLIWIGGGFLLSRLFRWEPLERRPEILALCGLIATAALTEFFSLFLPVLVPLRMVLSAGFLMSGAVYVWKKREVFSGNWPYVVVFAVLVVALVFRSMDLNIGPDTPLYHLMTLRYMHDHPAIPGLANLDVRLGFNSLFLPAAAMVDFGGTSARWFNVTVFAAMAITLLSGWRRFLKTSEPSDLMLAVGSGLLLADVRYLFSLHQEPVSGLFGLLILAEAYRLVYGKSKETPPAVLLLLCVSAVLVKRNLAWFALPGILALLTPLRNGVFATYKSVAALLLPTAMLSFPNVMRSVIQTGYLFFMLPFGRLPLDWAVPDALMRNKIDVVRIWFRSGNLRLDLEYARKFSEWFPDWLALYRSELILFATCWLVACFLLIISVIKSRRYGLLLLPLMMFLSLVSSYQVRFSEAWLAVLPAVAVGALFHVSGDNRRWVFFPKMVMALSLFVMLFGWKKNFALNRPGWAGVLQHWMFRSLMIEESVHFRTEINDRNEVFYTPLPTETPYYHFPEPAASRIDGFPYHYINAKPAFRGLTIRDGFVATDTVVRFGSPPLWEAPPDKNF